MSAFSIQDAHDLSAFAAQTLERLSQAAVRFEGSDSSSVQVDERGWLASATARVSAALEQTRIALQEAAPLPEFANARKVKSEELSNAWADAVESVFDGIVANVSANGPLIEALFPHQRFASLRRPGAAAHNFWLELERRAESSYVRRLCSDPAYEFLPPLLAAARESEQKLRELVAPKPLPEARAVKLRDQVSAAAESLELELRRTRALCEAAFAATPTVVAELGLDAKPKRRAQRAEKPTASPN
jgi:hypothetical protein